jgi:hypothetical protein
MVASWGCLKSEVEVDKPLMTLLDREPHVEGRDIIDLNIHVLGRRFRIDLGSERGRIGVALLAKFRFKSCDFLSIGFDLQQLLESVLDRSLFGSIIPFKVLILW